MIEKFLNFINNSGKKKIFYLLLGITFILRLYAVLMAQGIANDSAAYGFMARDFMKWDFIKGLSSPLHPLYPFLISLISPDTGQVEIVGRIISLFFGTLTLLPVYYLSKEIVGQKGAIFSCLFYSFHPYLVTYSGMLLSEATYWGLLTLSIYFFWTGLNLNRVLRIILSGFFLGIAYLTRPEGLGYIIIFLFWVIIFYGLRKGWLKKFFFMGLILLPLALFSIPYLLYIYQEEGQWIITKKGLSIQSDLLNLVNKKDKGEEKEISREERIKFHLYRKVRGMISCIPFTIYHYLKAYHFALWLFLFFGLIGIKWRRSRAEMMIASVILFHLISLAFFTKSTTRFSVPVIPISLIWAGAGVLEMKKYLKKITLSKANQILIALIILSLIIQLPQSLKPERKHRREQKMVGLWLKEHTSKDSKIMSNSPIEAFYAEREFILLPHEIPIEGIPGKSYQDIIQFAKEKRINYILVNKYTEERNPNFIKSIQPSDLKEFYHKRERDGSMIIIYEVVP